MDMRMMRIGICLITVALLICSSLLVQAATPQGSYLYDPMGPTVASPKAYELDRVINGSVLGIDSFNSISDIFVDSNGYLYISDTGNNRIVVLDENYGFVKIIQTFHNQGKEDSLNAANGIFVTGSGEMYIADTGNNRVVKLDAELNCLLEITRPDTTLVEANYVFLPEKVVCDSASRIFVISDNQPQGVMEFTSDGQFRGFIGANKVIFDWQDYIWKLLATEKQRAKMALFLPTEYNNIHLDEDEFLFVTTDKLDFTGFSSNLSASAEDLSRYSPVRRLNLAGSDVMKRDPVNMPMGDYIFDTGVKGLVNGPSRIIDSATTDNGIFSILDSARGRIFTYDSSSRLLAVSGGIGLEEGKFMSPSSLCYKGDSIIVADYHKHDITVMKPTAYGQLILDAYESYEQGEYQRNMELWEEIRTYNVHNNVAYTGLAKSYLRNKDYINAMKFAKYAEDQETYALAFKKQRDIFIREYFGTVIICIAVLVVAIYVFLKMKKYIKWVKQEIGKL